MLVPKDIDLVYGTGLSQAPEEEVEQTIEEQDQDALDVSADLESEEDKKEILKDLPPFTKRISAYVSVMEDMVNIIAGFEAELLSHDEREMLYAFSKLSYSSRYTAMRLVFRKPDQWHPRSSMSRFIQEIGEEGLDYALTELCLSVPEIIKRGDPSGTSADEAIDLTGDSDDEDVVPQKNDFIIPPGGVKTGASDVQLDFFCESENNMSLQDILARLTKPKLEEICREFKCKPRKNPKKEDFITTLLSHAGNQCSITAAFASQPNKKSKATKPNNKSRQSTLHSFVPGSSKNLLDRLKSVAAKKLGPCLRVNTEFLHLIRRLQVIYYRSTQHLPSLLLPSLLTHFKKRTYPPYSYARSRIWFNREEFLKYENALDIMEVVDKLLSDKTEAERARTRGVTEASEREESRARTILPTTPAPPARDGTPGLVLPEALVKGPEVRAQADAKLDVKEEVKEEELDPFLEADTSMDDDLDVGGYNISIKSQTSIYEIMAQAAQVSEEVDADENLTDTARQSKKLARMLVALYEEKVKVMWEEAVETELRKRKKDRLSPALERFQAGHVLTRIVGKVASAYATLKQHQREAEVLDALLAQRFWRRGKRAEWYERRALIGQNYLAKGKGALKRVREEIIEALEDSDTHLIARPALFKRLEKIEKRLKMPDEERTQSEGQLEEANEVYIKATRLWSSKKSEEKEDGKEKEKDSKGKGKGKEKENQTSLVSGVNGVGGSEKPTKSGWRWTGKSLWRGRTPDEEVNVETAALYYYEDQGFKGFHSETSILTTLFALLFWDIIFATIPGAFETRYQIAPLDLVEDAFYRARKEVIDKRLEDINNGQARNILERHYEMHGGCEGKKETWCVGMRWDVGSKADLGEIVECMGGATLVHVCRLFCEDYSARTSGVPDLIIWNFDTKECRFVEVKGPNDRASASQKLWFDTLLRAGTAVDLCHVEDRGAPSKQSSKKRKRPYSERGDEADSSRNLDPDDVLTASQERVSTPEPPGGPQVVIVSPSMVKRRRKVQYLS
ncbi:hypothetical protein VKT23_011000 [Stygiomarasmius scandens]|uniref:Fanconi-associated nuclease n=1 Tax=Marasmiellus scandens TaxID=2682957 RepID=A0ABR1JAI0_9AGAR